MQLNPATSQATADESEKESEQQQQQKEEDDEPTSSTSGDLPQYEQGEDYEKAASHKMKASELVSSGDFTGALDEYNHAVVSAPPSALLLASRADVLLHLKRYQDAVRDCNQALETNPDSAKALRIRGRALKELKDYEGSRRDLAASQQIDYDDEAAKDLKFVMDKVNQMEKEHVKKKLEVSFFSVYFKLLFSHALYPFLTIASLMVLYNYIGGGTHEEKSRGFETSKGTSQKGSRRREI